MNPSTTSPLHPQPLSRLPSSKVLCNPSSSSWMKRCRHGWRPRRMRLDLQWRTWWLHRWGVDLPSSLGRRFPRCCLTRLLQSSMATHWWLILMDGNWRWPIPLILISLYSSCSVMIGFDGWLTSLTLVTDYTRKTRWRWPPYYCWRHKFLHPGNFDLLACISVWWSSSYIYWLHYLICCRAFALQYSRPLLAQSRVLGLGALP